MGHRVAFLLMAELWADGRSMAGIGEQLDKAIPSSRLSNYRKKGNLQTER